MAVLSPKPSLAVNYLGGEQLIVACLFGNCRLMGDKILGTLKFLSLIAIIRKIRCGFRQS